MIQKIKNFINSFKKSKIEKENFAKAKKYYELVKGGSMFLKYIHEDIEKNRNSMPRSQRRRLDQDITKRGQFTKEIINRYSSKIDDVLKYIQIQESKKK